MTIPSRRCNFIVSIAMSLLPLLGSCTKKKSAPAEPEAVRNVAPGMGDLEEVRFFMGQTETTHAFNPATATLDSKFGPLTDEDINAIFSHAMSRVVRSMDPSIISVDKLDQNLPKLLEALKLSLQQAVREVNNELPSFPYIINFGLLPWVAQGGPFIDDGFSYASGRADTSSFVKPGNFFSNVTKYVSRIQEMGYKQRENGLQNFLLGGLLRLSLMKNQSSYHFELLIGLNPREIPFEREDPAISLKKIVIPDNGTPSRNTVMLVRSGQKIEDTSPPPASVHFGAFKTIAEGSRGELSFQLEQDSTTQDGFLVTRAWNHIRCDKQHYAQPYLVGNVRKASLPERLAPADNLVSVDFRFKDIDLSMEKTQVTHIELGIAGGFDVLGLRFTAGCFNNDSIEKKFQEQINLEIQRNLESTKTKLNEHPVIKILRGAAQ